MTNLPFAKKRKNLLWCIDISHFGACMRLAFRRHVNAVNTQIPSLKLGISQFAYSTCCEKSHLTLKAYWDICP